MSAFNPEDFLVLVVDDVSKNIQVLVEMLERIGYSTTFTRSGPEALTRIDACHPDLVILDLMMPGMDGLQVCQHLKTSGHHRDPPVIVLSASNEQEHIVQAFERGAVDYISKPFRPTELLARVRTHLELKRMRDSMDQQQSQAQAQAQAQTQAQTQAQADAQTQEPASQGETGIAAMVHELSAMHKVLAELTKATLPPNQAAMVNELSERSTRLSGQLQQYLDLGDA